MKQTRVALVGKSPLMLAMIEEILAGHDDIDVTARLRRPTPQSRKLRNVDLVICVADSEEGVSDDAATPALMLQGRPHKLLTIAADGRRATICVLLPCLHVMNELSASSLIAAIREAI